MKKFKAAMVSAALITSTFAPVVVAFAGDNVSNPVVKKHVPTFGDCVRRLNSAKHRRGEDLRFAQSIRTMAGSDISKAADELYKKLYFEYDNILFMLEKKEGYCSDQNRERTLTRLNSMFNGHPSM